MLRSTVIAYRPVYRDFATRLALTGLALNREGRSCRIVVCATVNRWRGRYRRPQLL